MVVVDAGDGAEDVEEGGKGSNLQKGDDERIPIRD